MAPDNAQVEYRYISQRQVREIVGQNSARHPTRPWNIALGVGPVGASVTFPGNAADLENTYDLALRSERALEGNVHRLEDLETNPIPDNSYLTLTMPLQECVIQPFDDVVGYVGLTTLTRVGTVFVGLIGSAANLAGSPSDTRIVPYSGRHASHQIGFKEFIGRAMAESDTPNARPRQSDRHRRDREELIADAIASFAGSRIRTPVEHLDGLVRVHVAAGTENQFLLDGPLDPVSRRGGPFYELRELIRPDYVILGSPVWLRTREPSAFEPEATRFEELVRDCAGVVAGLYEAVEVRTWPPRNAWTDWCKWCAAELSSSAANPRPFLSAREPGRWARLRGEVEPVMTPHGEAWFIGVDGNRGGFALTTNGDVYAEASATSTDGDIAVICADSRHRVESDSDALPAAAERLLFAVLAARTPLSQEGEWSFALCDGTFRWARA